MICRKTIFLDIGVGGGLGWVQLNRARTDAILTPHLMRHAPAVFLEPFPVSSYVIHFRDSYDWRWQERLGAK